MKALQGIRMLDLTHMVSGPYAGMLLADLGAETIKVEPPGEGERTRRVLADDPRNCMHGMGAYFLPLNRNKKSVTLNLKSEAGLALFYELVAHSDVVLTNFSVGVTARLKIDYAHLSAVNPRIITASITGFGETGPLAGEVSFDMVAQAMGGNMSITGQAGAPPTRAGVPFGDVGGGLMGVIGVLAALLARETTGRGQHVDVSMLDAQISMLTYLVTMNHLSGVVPAPMGNAHFVHVPYDSYPCSDGYLILAIIADDFWMNLMALLDAPDLDTPENRRQPGRLKNRAVIDARLAEIFSGGRQADWVAKLRGARIPCAPVNNLQQALTEAQVLARNMVVEVEHALGGTVKMAGNPIKLSDAGADVFSSPPTVGAHTDEILGNLLGRTDAELADLRERGVI